MASSVMGTRQVYPREPSIVGVILLQTLSEPERGEERNLRAARRVGAGHRAGPEVNGGPAAPGIRREHSSQLRFDPISDPASPVDEVLGEGVFPERVHLSEPLRSEEHTSELQSRENLVCRLLLEKKKNKINTKYKSKKKIKEIK